MPATGAVGTIVVLVRSEIEDFVRGMRAASREIDDLNDRSRRASDGFLGAAAGATKLVAGLGALAPAAGIIAGIGTSATTTAGALLVLPAAGLGAAAAIGTLKLAVAGFGDAVSAADPAAFAEATKEFAPSAREGAQALNELVNGPLKDLKREVQGAFFTGFATDVRQLGGAYLPVMRTQLTGIAGEYANMRRDAVQALLAPDAVRAVNTVLGDTRGVLGDMRPALANVLAGILDIAGQGSAEFRGFGQAVTDASTRFRQWADQAAESGRITELIREGKEEFARWGEVASNVGGIISTIFEGVTDEAGYFSETMIVTTQRVEDFLNSVQGQEALQQLGETLRVTAEVARDIFMAALEQLGGVIVAAAPAVREFATVLGTMLVNAINTVGPLIQGFAQFLSDNAAVINVLVPLLAGLLGGLLALRAITTVIGWVNGLAAAFGLMTTFVGPAGLIIVGLAAAAAAIGAFALANSSSAQDVEDHRARVQALTGTLDEFTGKATLATRETIAQELSTKTLADGQTLLRDALDRTGIGFQEYAAAAAGNEEALARVNRQLLDQGIAFVENEANLNRWAGVIRDAGVPTETLALALIGNEEAVASLTEQYGISESTVDAFVDALRRQNPELAQVGQTLGAYNAAVREAGDAARESAAATRDFGESLNAIKAGLSGLAEGQQALPLMVQGFRDLAASAQDSAQSAAENAFAYGGVDAAVKAATDSMQQSRDQFIRTATEAGLTAEAAAKLADEIGLIPAAQATIFTTNAEGVAAELITLKGQFDAVPNAKSITVNALTDEARQQLMIMGFEIRELPNGQFEIIANAEQARATLTETVNAANTAVGTVTIDGDANPAQEGIQRVVTLADGSTGTITIDGDGNPAIVELDGVKYRVDATTGVMTIDGDAGPGEGKRAGLKIKIDNTTGAVKVGADVSSAESSLTRLVARWQGRTIQIGVSTPGRLAGGGIIGGPGNLGMAGGGFMVPGYGPGRDTFGPVWLSPGEAVLVPEYARRLGYRNILRNNYLYSGGRAGQVLGRGGGGMAGGGVAGRDYLSALPAAGATGRATVVQVPPPVVENHFYVDGEEFRGMMRSEIVADQRETSRRVRAGQGVSY